MQPLGHLAVLFVVIAQILEDLGFVALLPFGVLHDRISCVVHIPIAGRSIKPLHLLDGIAGCPYQQAVANNRIEVHQQFIPQPLIDLGLVDLVA